MELEEKREMEAGLLVFDLRACKTFGLREEVMTRVMVLYDNQEGKRKFVIFNKGLAQEIHGKISVWLDANMGLQDILNGIGREGVDLDQWSMQPKKRIPTGERSVSRVI
jgi:hypothetical protein